MKRLLPWLVVFVALGVEAKKPPPKPKPVEKPAPVEEPEEAPPDDTFDLPDEDPPIIDDADATPPPRTDKKDSTGTSKSNRRRNSDLSDDEAAALGFASICCCLLFVVGLVVLIVWLVKRGKPAQAAPLQPTYPGGVPPMGQPVPHAAPPSAVPVGAAGMQLSIFALALEPSARQVVEESLATAGVSAVPTSPDGRGRLVREAARALLTVQPSWRHFGYGEKPGIPDLAGAEGSYRSASEDFRQRSASVGATSDGTGLVVVTLLICCRRALLGVSRLDDPMQVRNVLEDRMKVSDADLLGTELLWAPIAATGRVTEAEISLRFPEMLPLVR